MININVQILEYFQFELNFLHILYNKYLKIVFDQLIDNQFLIKLKLFHFYLNKFQLVHLFFVQNFYDQFQFVLINHLFQQQHFESKSKKKNIN